MSHHLCQEGYICDFRRAQAGDATIKTKKIIESKLQANNRSLMFQQLFRVLSSFHGVTMTPKAKNDFFFCVRFDRWRSGVLMVSALDFRSRGRWFRRGHCRHVVSLDKKLYSTLSLSTQVYKWVPAIIVMLGGNLAIE